MKNLILFGFLLTLLFSSCKKEEPSQLEVENYLPSSVGSYWIYEHFRIDTNGVEESINHIDSFVIRRDTSINDKKYAVLEMSEGKGWRIERIFRDSALYTVDHTGRKLFSAMDFTNVLDSFVDFHNGEIVLKVSNIMERNRVYITVPAGTFSTINKKGSVYYKSNRPSIPDTRYNDVNYANNVGIVRETYFFTSSPETFEKRLIRYHIEE